MHGMEKQQPRIHQNARNQMTSITLSPDEVAVCHLIGRSRSMIARAANVKDAKVGDQDGAWADVMGVMGEYAFAKIFNCFPDIGLSPRSGSCDGTYQGWRYDIKSTTYQDGRLLCTTKDNEDVDIYILAIVDEPKVTLAGFATKEDLRKDENLTDLGHGVGYALTQNKLKPFNITT